MTNEINTQTAESATTAASAPVVTHQSVLEEIETFAQKLEQQAQAELASLVAKAKALL